MPLGRRPILILRNGSFYTMSRAVPHAAALAIDRTSGYILAVGDEAEVQALSGPLTDTLDLGGRAVLPGFIDAHIHLVHHVQSRLGVELRGAASEEAAAELVRERAAETRAGTWILGRGWDKNLWPGGRFPSKSSLDTAAPHHPVALWDHAGHAMWVNSEALRRARVTDRTPERDDGVIAREPDGAPTGMLFELGATNLVSAVITAPDESVLTEGLAAVLHELGARGITGVHNIEDDRSLRLLQHLHGSGRLTLRVLLYLQKKTLPSAVRLGLQAGFGDDYLRFAGIKLFMDGALGPQTAAMLEPYENQPNNRGLLTLDEEEVIRQVSAATAGGLGIAIHAIGDRAVHTALDGIEATLRASARGRSSLPTRPPRIRLEHVQLAAPADIQRMASLGIVASVQPFHAVVDRDTAERSWGKRHRRAYAYKTLAQAGIPLALGSDLPVDTADPLRILHAAVTRQNDQEHGRPAWISDQALSVQEAVWSYTMGAAYAGGQEELQGSLEVGKLADMVVLDDDPFKIPPERLAEIQVAATLVGGDLVYGVLE
jgi:predicted amidohydrolase YtcJ